ncbi:MAG: Uma2 family endonuclease [Betaproteobacteria bacterium]
MGLPLRTEGHYTYADYCGWDDDQRWELIDGQAYAMAPGPTRAHQIVVGEVFRQIANALEGKRCQAYVAPFDVRLPRGDEADDSIDTVVQPDIAVFCDPTKLDARGARGAPDGIVEVLSPSSAQHDHVRKRALYERSGVAEYWLVHPTDRVVHVYRAVDGRYGRPDVATFDGSATSAAAGGVTIDFARIAALLP